MSQFTAVEACGMIIISLAVASWFLNLRDYWRYSYETRKQERTTGLVSRAQAAPRTRRSRKNGNVVGRNKGKSRSRNAALPNSGKDRPAVSKPKKGRVK